MTTLATRLRYLGDLEGFDIEVLDQNGNVVDPKTNGFEKYDFDRRSKGSTTVSEWKEKRFKATYPGHNCRVLKADGTEAHGNVKLDSIRITYEEE